MKLKLFFILTLISLALVTQAQTQIDGINYQFNGSEAKVVSIPDCYTGDVVIPETVSYNGNAYIVTAIGQLSFFGCTDLISVTLPSTIISIDAVAFADAINLETVTMSEGVLTIADSAFSDCAALSNITLPNSITSIGSNAFRNCSSLETINVPAGVTNLSPYTFTNCTALTSVSFAEGLEVVGNSAFSYCISLNNIMLPESLTTIGQDSFFQCLALTNLVVPNNVNTINEAAFANCTALESVILPPNLTALSDFTFSNCTNLTIVNLGEGLTTIGNGAFGVCEALTNINLPSTLNTIGGSAFGGCSGLLSISLPAQVSTIEGNAFNGCTSLTEVTALRAEPINIGSSVFSNVDIESIPLRVTGGNVNAYNAASVWQDFLSITSFNSPPSITSIDDQTLCEGYNVNLTLLISDADTTQEDLIVTATSSNQSIVNNSDISLQASNGNFTFSAMPVYGSFGSVVITITATDMSDETSTETFEVVFEEDTLPPVFNTCQEDIAVEANSNNTYIMENYWNGLDFSDNCFVFSIIQDPAVGTEIPVGGIVPVTITISDLSDNSATCSFNITTTLSTSPSLVLPELKIYPNPAREYITIDKPKSIDINKVTIFDLTGRHLEEYTYTNTLNQNEVKVDLSRLPIASYIIRVQTSNGLTAYKMVIKK